MIHLFELIVTSMPCKHKQVEMGLHHCFPPCRPLLLFLFLNPVASFEDSGKLSPRELVSLSKGCQFGKCQTPCMCGRVSLSKPKLFLPGQNFQFNTTLNMIWSESYFLTCLPLHCPS